jgi:hypothetical protein
MSVRPSPSKSAVAAGLSQRRGCPAGGGLGRDPPGAVALDDDGERRAAGGRRAHDEDFGRAVAVEIGEARFEVLEHGALAGGNGRGPDRNGAGLGADPGQALSLLDHEPARLDPVAEHAVRVIRARLGEKGRERARGLAAGGRDRLPRRLGEGRLLPGRGREGQRLHPAADEREDRAARPAPGGGVRARGKRAFADHGLGRGQRPREVRCGAAELGNGEGQRQDLDPGLRRRGRCCE